MITFIIVLILFYFIGKALLDGGGDGCGCGCGCLIFIILILLACCGVFVIII